MAILASLHHVTRYKYDRPVSLGHRQYVSGPRRTAGFRCEAIRSRSTPEPHFVNWQQDPHGSWLARYVFPEKNTPSIRSRSASSPRWPSTIHSISLSRTMPRRRHSPMRRTCAQGLAPYLEVGAARAAPGKIRRLDPDDAYPDHRLPCRAQRPRQREEISYLIRLEPGVQTPRRR